MDVPAYSLQLIDHFISIENFDSMVTEPENPWFLRWKMVRWNEDYCINCSRIIKNARLLLLSKRQATFLVYTILLCSVRIFYFSFFTEKESLKRFFVLRLFLLPYIPYEALYPFHIYICSSVWSKESAVFRLVPQ